MAVTFLTNEDREEISEEIKEAIAEAELGGEEVDLSPYMLKTELPTAVNDALAQAKASGEFDGKDGTSATHSWNGTVLTVTSASGTSSADLKGDKGDKGEQGIQGEKGADGAKGDKGDKGETGATGAAGATPVKGTDYFTAADKAEMVNAVIAALPVYAGEVV